MRVPVVQIGPVRVGVRHRFMHMVMKMSVRCRQTWMFVIVMAVVVPVPMGVGDHVMGMFVRMVFDCEQGNR